jgi:hypothetical protein
VAVQQVEVAADDSYAIPSPPRATHTRVHPDSVDRDDIMKARRVRHGVSIERDGVLSKGREWETVRRCVEENAMGNSRARVIFFHWPIRRNSHEGKAII